MISQGRVIGGKYVLERPAGSGGMAQLWVATNRATSAEVCVKLFVPGAKRPSEQYEEIERFRREARASANLRHRSIVHVFDLLELDEEGHVAQGAPSAYAIVMELLRGQVLGEAIETHGPFPLEEAIDLFLGVLSALAHAHREGVVHRDLKPDNVFLVKEPDGHVIPKVLDFGISKVMGASALTEDGIVVGTASFMSPEQARGARVVDARSDVFSAAIVFVVMVTGANPFGHAVDLASTLDAILRRDVQPLPDLPPRLRAVFERALAKDPKARFADAGEFAAALREAAGRAPSASSPALPRAPLSSRVAFDSVPPPDLRPARRRVPLVALGLVVAAGAGFLLWPRSPRAVAPSPAPSASLSAASSASQASAAPAVSIALPPPPATTSAPSVKPASPRPPKKPQGDRHARDPGF